MDSEEMKKTKASIIKGFNSEYNKLTPRQKEKNNKNLLFDFYTMGTTEGASLVSKLVTDKLAKQSK